MQFLFSSHLIPEVKGFAGHLAEGWWIFKQGFTRVIGSIAYFTIYFQDEQRSTLENTTKSSKNTLANNSLANESLAEESLADESFADEIFVNNPDTATEVSSVPLEIVEDGSGAASSSRAVVSEPATVHQQPNWLQDLKKKFYAEIISSCSARTMRAVELDEFIEVIIWKEISFINPFFLYRMEQIISMSTVKSSITS